MKSKITRRQGDERERKRWTRACVSTQTVNHGRDRSDNNPSAKEPWRKIGRTEKRSGGTRAKWRKEDRNR